MQAQHGRRTEWLVGTWLFASLAGQVLAAWSDDEGASQDGFPYEVYVYVDQADVVAGPGYRYYVTARLPLGTRIEVYQEDPSGWLAIRPPDGSFSWVPADYVDRHPNHPDVGIVKAPIGSWVGTSVERVAQHRQQVTLQKGELVRIFGEKEVPGREGQTQRWLKIAPPAGEFRWIHLRDVRRGKPPAVDPPPATSLELVSRGQRGSQREDREPAPEPESGVDQGDTEGEGTSHPMVRTLGTAIPLFDLNEADAPSPSGLALAQYAAAQRGGSPDGFVPRRRSFGSGEGLALLGTSPPGRPASQPHAPVAATSPRKSSVAQGPAQDDQALRVASIPALRGERASRLGASAADSESIGGEEAARRLEQLEVELALMLARDRSQWNLAALRDQALVLVERGADPAWRGRARMLVDRIEQLADAFESSLPERPLVSASATDANEGAPARRPVEDVRYDAQGWLKEVVSRQGNKPPAPYAVVDAQGRPVCFVSPVPGLNLHRYLNRQVGLFGRRGWLAELQKPHLLAERVVELDR